MDPDDEDIIHAMLTYGGSFINALGALWQRADADNRARIKVAWPEYWEKYAEVAKRKQEVK